MTKNEAMQLKNTDTLRHKFTGQRMAVKDYKRSMVLDNWISERHQPLRKLVVKAGRIK